MEQPLLRLLSLRRVLVVESFLLSPRSKSQGSDEAAVIGAGDALARARWSHRKHRLATECFVTCSVEMLLLQTFATPTGRFDAHVQVGHRSSAS